VLFRSVDVGIGLIARTNSRDNEAMRPQSELDGVAYWIVKK